MLHPLRNRFVRLDVLNIRDVAERHLCCGCGACAYINPDEIQMVDDFECGRRPVTASTLSDGHGDDALRVCPGVGLTHEFDCADPALVPGMAAAWGPVREVWEGHAGNPDIRFAGSSGGVASALALFCIEQGGMHGLLHIAARADVPYLNHTVLSTCRQQILNATGSRYAPASPCDGLQKVESAPQPCVFIGKPCDVAATSKARQLRPALDAKLGLTIAVFCAGTPSTRGTVEMFKQMGIADLSAIKSVRYRGNGWPGKATVHLNGPEGEEVRELTYQQSWGDVLQKHRQWRCYVCVDHTGEFADISVGDPWYRPIPKGEPGQSLVIVRTERGRKLMHAAMAAGYLSLRKVEPDIVEKSQPGFPTVRGQVWARIWMCRILGAAAPRYRNLPMFRFWWAKLTLQEKIKSFVGTARRVVRKKLLLRAPIAPFEPPEAVVAAAALPARSERADLVAGGA
jgi:coenzyme F420 hydrogenase subunit beta